MSTRTAIYNALASKLAGTAVTTLLGGTAVYAEHAGAAPLPYVVYSIQAGGPLNYAPSDLRDEVIFARCYAETSTLAGSVDAAISTLLHRGTLAVSGWNLLGITRESDISLTETDQAGVRTYVAGGFYRISLTD